MLSRVICRLRRLAADRKGAANIEYVLIAVLVAIGSLAALTAMADSLIGIWSDVEGEVTTSMSGSDEQTSANNDLSFGSFKAKGSKGKGKGKGQEKSKDAGK